MAHVAIVGAGLAGASLAQILTRSGHHCLLFEKSRGLGGRLATRRFEGWQADHGTQYFTVRSPEFAAEVAKWRQNNWVEPWSVEPWLLDRDGLRPSPDTQQRWVGVPTMNQMIKGLTEGLEICRQTRIDRLEAAAGQWRLWDEKGEHYGLFDAVLLTAPLAQSMALLPAGLPHLETPLRGASMTPTWAVALAFAEPTGIRPDALFSRDGLVTWAARDSSKPGRPQHYETWVVHFDPRWSANHLDASAQLLLQQAQRTLERLAGQAIAAPAHSFQHRWLYARARTEIPGVEPWDADYRIGLAGDWTLGSRLEDAWLSAHVLAQRLLRDLGQPTLTGPG